MIDTLRDAMRHKIRIAVMFSGGLDSALLAGIAHDSLGEDALALTIDSPIVPRADIEDAVRVGAQIGIRHEVIALSELDDREFTVNSPQRCYICRKLRDRAVWEIARRRGIDTIADGMNLDDLADYRPGRKASDEDGIWHPFIECGFTKEDLRALAKDLGLSLWDKPSEACFCSRIAYGMKIERELLSRIEKAEAFLKTICPGPIRVRCFPHDVAMIETANPDAAVKERAKIVPFFRKVGFAFIGLDLEGFSSGKMNRILS